MHVLRTLRPLVLSARHQPPRQPLLFHHHHRHHPGGGSSSSSGGGGGPLRAWLSTQTRDRISQIVGTAPVVLFMKGTPDRPQCGFSKATVQILSLQGVDPLKFAAFDVLQDEEVRQGIKEYSDWPTIPQLYVNKEFVGGCDIMVSMHQSGELAELLEREDVLAPPVSDRSDRSEGERTETNAEKKE